MNKRRYFLQKLAFIMVATNIMTVHAQSKMDAPSEYEKQLREKVEVAEKITRENLDTLYKTTNNTDSADKKNIKGFVLSADVMTFNDIPKQIDNDIAVLKDKIRYTILKVATDIENPDGSSGKVSIGINGVNYKLPMDARREFEDFMDGKEKNNISLRSVQIAMQLFASINKQIMDEAKRANNVQEKKRLYITQAVYVYELSGIVLDILGNVSLEGKKTIEKIKSENEGKISERINKMNSELTQIREGKSAGKITEKEAVSYEKIYSNLIAANQESLKGWNDLMKMVGNQEEWLLKMKNQTNSIVLKRNAAKHQLDTLRDVAVVSELMAIVGDMDELVAIIKEIPLLDLDPATVQELLFGKPIIKDEKNVKPVIIN